MDRFKFGQFVGGKGFGGKIAIDYLIIATVGQPSYQNSIGIVGLYITKVRGVAVMSRGAPKWTIFKRPVTRSCCPLAEPTPPTKPE